MEIMDNGDGGTPFMNTLTWTKQWQKITFREELVVASPIADRGWLQRKVLVKETTLLPNQDIMIMVFLIVDELELLLKELVK